MRISDWSSDGDLPISAPIPLDEPVTMVTVPRMSTPFLPLRWPRHSTRRPMGGQAVGVVRRPPPGWRSMDPFAACGLQIAVRPGYGWPRRWRIACVSAVVARSEERRVGKEWGRPCRSRWAPYQYKNNTGDTTQAGKL